MLQKLTYEYFRVRMAEIVNGQVPNKIADLPAEEMLSALAAVQINGL
jgi:hypothetical protein